jgi:UDP-N-acetyl-D-glucosamine dehydrogenase
MIAIFGLGYVGTPLAQAFCQYGARVVGVDPSDERRAAAMAAVEGQFDACDLSSLGKIRECDAILVCVPTPLKKGLPDLSYVDEVARTIAAEAREGSLVVLESTVYPGYTSGDFTLALESTGKSFLVAFSPEREDPGSNRSLTEIPKLVGATSPQALEAAVALYAEIFTKVVAVSSAEVAEAAKLLENSFRAVNIALVNEFKEGLDRIGVDAYEVIRAAATKPFGFMPFQPGPGVGGHCIPVDPHYFIHATATLDYHPALIATAMEINAGRPVEVSRALRLAVARRYVPYPSVLFIGMAYKVGVPDLRNSPAVEVLSHCFDEMEVSFYDPLVDSSAVGKKATKVEEVVLSEIGQYDAVVIFNRQPLDYDSLVRSASSTVRADRHRTIILDTVGACTNDEIVWKV